MIEAKLKITDFVRDYERVFLDEFTRFKEAHKVKVELQKNKFSEIKETNILERALYEVPETLYAILKTRLTEDEANYLRSREGGRWFAKTFPEFRITTKV